MKEEDILHYYCSNIFSLYNTIKEYGVFDGSIDLINVLKEETSKHNEVVSDLCKVKYSYEVSEIYLFFDYDLDIHNKLTIEEQNRKIIELFNYFENENLNERNGVKLYINYPMIESYRFFKTALPDDNYKEYTFNLTCEKSFKQLVNEYSFYKTLKYLCFDIKKSSAELRECDDNERTDIIKQNWLHIKDMNIKKANYICSGSYSVPSDKNTINQRSIFDNQIKKYVTPHQKIAILNAFPLFWFEYIKKQNDDE